MSDFSYLCLFIRNVYVNVKIKAEHCVSGEVKNVTVSRKPQCKDV